MTPSTDGPGQPGRRSAVPPPLTVAVSLAAVEAAFFVLLAVSLLPSIEGERLVAGGTSAAFFLLYGGFLGYCAWQMYRLRSWARSPLVVAQLIQIFVGASFWGDVTTAVAVVAILLALLTLAGIFHPSSLAALESDRR